MKITILAFLISASFLVSADSDLKIPVPKISICEAIDLSRKQMDNETRLRGKEKFKPSDYIVISAKYGQNKKTGGKWVNVWTVRYVHPEDISHVIVYNVKEDGSVEYSASQ